MAARVNPVVKALAKAVTVYADNTKDPILGTKGMDAATAYDNIAKAVQLDTIKNAVLEAIVAEATKAPRKTRKAAV